VRMFGVLFPNRSFPLGITTFNQVDDHRWILDMNYFVGRFSSQRSLLDSVLSCVLGNLKQAQL
jgi:hypothetical protein